MATALYSCDDHLDLSAVPPTVWESRLPHALVEQGPRVVSGDRGAMWVCEGRTIGRSGLPPHADSVRMFSAIGRAGIDDDGSRAGRPDLRLADMDRDGLAASVIYGPLSLGFTVDDPQLQEACFAAWNDWAVEEFNAVAPDRLCVLAFLPSHSPEAAAAELERCAAIGHRGAIISAFDVDLGDRAWDRLWSAGEETGLPVSFHIKGGTSSGLSYRVGKWQSAAYASVLPLQLDEPLAIMVFGGALEQGSAAHAGARRVGGRLAAVLPRADGPRVGGAARQARLRAEGAAERAVPAPGRGHIRGGAAGRRAHPDARRRLVHVGIRLSPHRQHVPRVARCDRSARSAPAARRRPGTRSSAPNCARLYGFEEPA